MGFIALPEDRWSDPLFQTNRLVDVIFLSDMVMQFFLMYPTNDVNSAEGERWVRDQGKIAQRYLTSTWFYIDTLSILVSGFDMFAPTQLMDNNYHDYLFDIIKNERAINYKMRAAHVIGSKIVSPLIKGKKYRALLTSFTDELRLSKHFRDRQLYI